MRASTWLLLTVTVVLMSCGDQKRAEPIRSTLLDKISARIAGYSHLRLDSISLDSTALYIEWIDTIDFPYFIEDMAVAENILQEVASTSEAFDSLIVVMRFPMRPQDPVRQIRATKRESVQVLANYLDPRFAACADKLLKLSNPGHSPLPQTHINTIYAYVREPNGKDNFFGANYLDLVFAYQQSCRIPDHPAVLMMEQVESETREFVKKDAVKTAVVDSIFREIKASCGVGA